MVRAKPPYKTAGGKYYIADWIVSLFPPRDTYHTLIDATCRTGAVLLAHDPADHAEVANDLDGHVTNFWNVLKGGSAFTAFKRLAEATPFSQAEFEAALARKKPYDKNDTVTAALRLFVMARQSRAGDNAAFATLTRTRLRRGMQEQVSAWLSAVANLDAVHARIARWLVTTRDLFDLLVEWDVPGALVYLDPPYLVGAGARVTKSFYGEFDWPAERHGQLLDGVLAVKHVKIALSGYPTKLYNARLTPDKGWTRHDKEVPLHSAGGKAKRKQTESLWVNY